MVWIDWWDSVECIFPLEVDIESHRTSTTQAISSNEQHDLDFCFFGLVSAEVEFAAWIIPNSAQNNSKFRELKRNRQVPRHKFNLSRWPRSWRISHPCPWSLSVLSKTEMKWPCLPYLLLALQHLSSLLTLHLAAFTVSVFISWVSLKFTFLPYRLLSLTSARPLNKQVFHAKLPSLWLSLGYFILLTCA